MSANFHSPIYSLAVIDDFLIVSEGLGGKQYGAQNTLVSFLIRNLTNSATLLNAYLNFKPKKTLLKIFQHTPQKI